MIVMAKAPITKKKTVITSKSDVNLRKKLVRCCVWSLGWCDAETSEVLHLELRLV
jgi:hypothetical protein